MIAKINTASDGQPSDSEKIAMELAKVSLQNRRIAIVVSTYNFHITEKLWLGACETARAGGIQESNIDTFWVPGAWELPLACKRALGYMSYDAVLAFGCVIRGETTHDQHINRAVSTALMNMSLESEKPIGFGLLTVNTIEQAEARAGGTVGNKGEETMQAVLHMLRLFDSTMLGGVPF